MVAQQDDSDAASASSLLGPKDVKRGKTPATSLHNVADRKKANNITCIYCWSRKTLTDICVKSMKSFGFNPLKKD